MKVLSLFDGMACGMIAFKELGIPIERYVAYEIDKFAVKTATHNFPQIEEMGDVFAADFNEYRGFDWLIGGSPCTYWSIAQKNNREIEASGIGWELFSQYVRALHDAHPRFFIYENNKSMSNAIRESITETFGFEPVLINSALVSAQNRQRLYWVGKRNADGTYSKVDVKQPVDRGILLKDILDLGCDLTSKDKSYTLTASYNGAVPWNTIKRNQRNMVAEPVNITADGKSQTIKAQSAKTSIANICCYSSTYGASGVAEPVACRCRGRKYENGNGYAKYECREDNKANTLDTNSTNGTMVAEPVTETIRVYAVPLDIEEIRIRDNAHIVINENAIRGVQNKNNASCAESFYEFTDRKANTMTTAHTPKIIESLEQTKLFAVPCEWDENNIPTKAISAADGKTYQVYKVENGIITIKNKQYPIKLADGYYIIRKLTVSECKRLQTVPEWYEFPVSNAQSYKMLGNGWTVDVIKHLITSAYSRPVVKWTKQITFDEFVN